jgi:hypothetical protein
VARRGSVIVLVLAMVTLAAFFLSRFIERAMTEMVVESRAQQSARLRADAYSALETSLAVLADYAAIDGGIHSPAQGWTKPLAADELATRAGLEVEVTIEDESGKLSLPRLDEAGLEKLGKELGLKEADAARLADALLAWTRGEHNSGRYETDPRNYEYEDPPHRVPARALASFDELAAVAVAREFFFTRDGRRTPLLAELEQRVSLYDFPATNINTATAETLALAGLDQGQIGRLLDFNRGKSRPAPGAPPYFRSVAEAQTLLGGAALLAGFEASTRCLRVHVTIKEGPSRYRLSAVIAPAQAGNGSTPPPVENQAKPAAGNQAARPDPGVLQYPFTLLALEETLELQPPS